MVKTAGDGPVGVKETNTAESAEPLDGEGKHGQQPDESDLPDQPSAMHHDLRTVGLTALEHPRRSASRCPSFDRVCALPLTRLR